MMFQSLITEIDLTKAKLVRHNLSNRDVMQNVERGFFDIYQSIQSAGRFKDCTYLFSFLGTDGTHSKYIGCYKIIGRSPLDRNRLPKDLSQDNGIADGCVFYQMEKTDVLSDLENRLVIDWGKSTRSWCQNGTTPKEVLCILPVVSDIVFASYEKVVLTYHTLKTIVDNSKEHADWENRLSTVAGIYLITDTLTGKQYVGSASSETNGIWGRWSQYVHTKHGGNKSLKQLIEQDPHYCKHFQFSILEVFPIKRDRQEILAYEQLYKKKLCSIKFGLNDN